ncbi:glycerate kinase [Phycisphaerales bacterium AB-hyl4]|uniref:Glycerate kinase n=1 Tax=Natronomicrosphaera hydrolytica TaxID=3242702 RepID=A0ABV4UAL6_9BACT
MMRVLCAPDSLKESLSAVEAAAAMVRGVQAAGGEAEACPIADGGEGTVQAMVTATGGEFRTTRVMGPLGSPIDATWGVLGALPGQPKTAVIEMAAASGLPLVPGEQRDPTRTTTYGTGELVLAALEAGVQRIVLGIGGSATTDAGCGAAMALGVRFFDAEGRPIDEPITGGMLDRIEHIDLMARDRRLDKVELLIACDVTNPLTGPSGAAAVYGPQKGASEQQVNELDAGLANVANCVEQAGQADIRDMPGAGAAGGLGGGAVAMLGGELRRGAELVLETVGFEQRVRGSDLCLTGEGKLDGQSLSGKAVMAVMAAAKRQGIATVALVGAAEEVERAMAMGLAGCRVIGEGLPTSESIAHAGELMEKAAREVVLERKPTA